VNSTIISPRLLLVKVQRTSAADLALVIA